MNASGQTGFEALLMTAFVILLVILITSQVFQEQDTTTSILLAKNNTSLLFQDQKTAYVVKDIGWKNYGVVSGINTLGLNIVTDPKDIYRDEFSSTISSHPNLVEWIGETQLKIENATAFDNVVININRQLPDIFP